MVTESVSYAEVIGCERTQVKVKLSPGVFYMEKVVGSYNTHSKEDSCAYLNEEGACPGPY